MKNVINFNSHQQKKKEPINNETQLKLLNTICYELRCKIDKTIQLEINEMCSEYEIKQNDFIREVYSDLIRTIETMMKDINPTEFETFMTYPSLNEFDHKNQRSTEYVPN
jgi:hypothetical protein